MNFFRKMLKTTLWVLLVVISTFKLNVLADNIPVYLDNQQIELSNEVFIENGRVMVPLRAICESLGYQVDWNDWNKSAIIYKPELLSYVEFNIDSFDVWNLSGKNIIDVAPKIIEGRTYITLRALVESIGDNITWDENSKSVHITHSTKYDGIKSYNVENEPAVTRTYGYLPQIVNPSDGERKINEAIISRLSDKDEDVLINGKMTSVFRNNYEYEIKNNQNNILSIFYNKFSVFNKVTEGMNYPEDVFYFCDTFYKDTGKKLQIEDILKGTKEDIEKIIISAYEKCDGKVIEILQGMAGRGISENYAKCDNNYLLNNYDFYIEDNDLVLMVFLHGDWDYEGISTFKININDNASLFKEEFLQNFN